MNLLKEIFFALAPKRLPRDRAVILMYHSISDADYFSAVLPREFERQMTFLAQNNYSVVRLAELVRRLDEIIYR